MVYKKNHCQEEVNQSLLSFKLEFDYYFKLFQTQTKSIRT